MVKKTILDSGLVIISEYIPAFPSFALSYTLRNASRSETKKNNGIYHLIEHMVFKGTHINDQKKIADISDRLGGHLNAFTGKEITQYYLKAIDEKLHESFHLLTDIIRNSTFPEDEFIKEKNVVIQEIKESEDNPDTFAFETFYEELFKKNGLGYPIAGKEDVVAGFKRDDVFDYYQKNYAPDNLVLGAVGNVDHDELVKLATEAFKDCPPRKPRPFAFNQPAFHFETLCKNNDSLQQVYAITGFKATSAIDTNRHRFAILNDILGGGLSSRLHQEIRENRGLAYTVSSFTDNYLDCGIHIVYSVVENDKIEEYLDAVKTEILRLKKDGITDEELNRSRDHIKASVVLSLESTLSLMRYHVNQELNLQREVTVKEIIDNINATTKDDIHQLIDEYLDLDNAFILLYGDIDEKMSYSF